MRVPAALALSAALVAGAVSLHAQTSARERAAVERPFVQGGRVVLDLGAGHYVIEPSPDATIRVRWSTRNADDDVRVTARVEGREATVETSGPSHGFRVHIGLPARSELAIRLTAGDLTVRGIGGSKDVSAWAGNLTIGVQDPAEYATVEASVTAGNLEAAPFDAHKGGLFRSFSWEGSGRHHLRARLTAGDLRLVRDAAEPPVR